MVPRRDPVLKDYPAPGVDSQLLAADVEGGCFVMRLIGQPGASVPTHLHTGVVQGSGAARVIVGGRPGYSR